MNWTILYDSENSNLFTYFQDVSQTLRNEEAKRLCDYLTHLKWQHYLLCTVDYEQDIPGLTNFVYQRDTCIHVDLPVD